jgi:ribonuclease P protein component
VKSRTLAKAERLKSRKSIQTLFREGKAFSVFPYKLYYRWEDDSSCPQPVLAGFGVSSRFFRKAVDRNRIRRLGREAWRLQKHKLGDVPMRRCLQLFFLYTGRELPDYALVSGKIAVILEKLRTEEKPKLKDPPAAEAQDEPHQ